MAKKKLWTVFQNIDLIIAGTTLSALILFTFFGVVMRYVFGNPVTWGEEFSLLCIVIVVFFGAGAGFRMGSHIAIDIIVDRFPKKAQQVVEVCIFVLSIVILFYFLVQSGTLVAQMVRTKRTTDILDIPYSVIYSAFPIGCVLMLINYTMSVYAKIFKKGSAS